MEPKEALRLMIRNREWLDSNILEVQKEYAGKWIGVAGQKVASAALKPEQVVEELVNQDQRDEAVILLVSAGQFAQPI